MNIEFVYMPITRKLQSDETSLQTVNEQRQQSFRQQVQKASERVSKFYSEGWILFDQFDAQDEWHRYRVYVFRMDEPVIKVEDYEIAYITRIIPKEGFSKTHQTEYPYWTCYLSDGGVVNIHNHPDADRNNLQIIESKGWTLDEYEIECVPPIPVTFSEDGKWRKLESIVQYAEYHLVQQSYIEALTIARGSTNDSTEDEDTNE